jgi:hypothetical protein
MPKRCDLLTAAMTEAASPTQPAPMRGIVPLRAEPRMRRIFPRAEPDGVWRLESDAPSRPRQIVRKEVIERAFGPGTYDTLGHPDHWRMIDAGWFQPEDLHLPGPLGDPTYLVWRAFHHPMNEAHDILSGLFTASPGLGRWRGARLSNGLTLCDDAGAPRHATARVHGDLDLVRVAEEVAQMDTLVEIVLPDAVLPLLD